LPTGLSNTKPDKKIEQLIEKFYPAIDIIKKMNRKQKMNVVTDPKNR